MNYITKTDYKTALTCTKKLWLNKNKDTKKTEITADQQMRIDEGYYFEKLVRTHKSFKGGVEANEFKKEDALKETINLLNTNNEIFYELSFAYKIKDITAFVRCDIIKKNKDGSLSLFEIKSSNKIKPEHKQDLAYQKWVVEKAGYTVKEASFITLNKEYIRTSKIVVSKLIKVTPANELIEQDKAEVYKNLNGIISKLMKQKTQPKVQFSVSKCGTCPFKNFCHKNINKDSIEKLSRISKGKRAELLSNKVKYIKDIPADFKLTDKQTIQRETAISNKPHINKEVINNFMSTLKFPLNYLDFETINYGVPRYKNSKTYEQVVFQASLHIESKKGALEHKEILITDKKDPRERVADFLINEVTEKGSIVVYHASFEKSRIKELAILFPEKSEKLLSLIDRVVDLEEVFTKLGYYNTNFEGKTSIKYVLPVLVKELGYDRLAIQNGSQAQVEFLAVRDGIHKGKMKDKVRKDLLEYCKLDTLAMYEIKEAVRKMV
jgi:CRISPR/Cas system-associated exonuclease Cas4 (RecB family)